MASLEIQNARNAAPTYLWLHVCGHHAHCHCQLLCRQEAVGVLLLARKLQIQLDIISYNARKPCHFDAKINKHCNNDTLFLGWIGGLWDAGDDVYWEIFVSHSELGTSRSNFFGKVIFCNVWHLGPWYTSRYYIASHDRTMRQCRTWSVILHVSKAMVSSGEKGLQWVWMPSRTNRYRETQRSNVGMGQWYCRITVHIVHLDFRAKDCSWLLVCWEMFGKKHDDVLTFQCLFFTVADYLVCEPLQLFEIFTSSCHPHVFCFHQQMSLTLRKKLPPFLKTAVDEVMSLQFLRSCRHHNLEEPNLISVNGAISVSWISWYWKVL